jgi:hypothetical protein
MAKLNQIIAIEKGVKSRVYGEFTNLFKTIQKSELFQGVARSYQKLDEEGEDLPAERKKVQLTADEALKRTETILSELINTTARKDWSNNTATADLVVDGETIVEGVPVTFLLFLEKQLTDVRKFIGTLPTLDSSEDWNQDANSGLYKTPATPTHRTKKVQKPLVLFPATPEHPAQTQMITEDVLVGHWHTIKESGALPAPRKQQLIDRVESLINAVKQAREAANNADEVKTPDVGAAVFGYLLGE